MSKVNNAARVGVYSDVDRESDNNNALMYLEERIGDVLQALEMHISLDSGVVKAEITEGATNVTYSEDVGLSRLLTQDAIILAVNLAISGAVGLLAEARSDANGSA